MPDTASTEVTPKDVTDLLTRRDVQVALSEMLELLPKLSPVLSLLGKGVDVAKEVLTDGDLMGGIEEMVAHKAKPYQAKAREVASILQEAKIRAERNTDSIGIFGLMRMLKDPNVQYGLHYAQAVCDLLSEHRQLHRNPIQ